MDRRKLNKKKSQKGIALLEALIAAVIVGIGFAAVYGLSVTSTRVLLSSIEREKQNMLATMIYEDLITDKANLISYHNQNFKQTSNSSTKSVKDMLNKWKSSADKKSGTASTNDVRKISVVKKTGSGKGDYYVVTIDLASRDGKAKNQFKKVINKD